MGIFDKCTSYNIPDKIIEAGMYPYFRMIESQQDPVVIMDGREVIMIGSNNYLGLTSHPKVKEAAIEAIRKYGTGCAGSRFLNGTLDIHVELEEKLARFFRKEGALVFATGYQTNLGVLSAVICRGDVAISDRLNHASIVDGLRLSMGEVRKFKHNDMVDLDRVLEGAADRNKMVVVDGVFSMEGDISPVDQIVALRDKHDFGLMVDDAHGVGVLGETGRGTAEHFGIEDDVDIIMGTYSKSLATIGGFVVASDDIIKYLKHTSRSLIFSASLAPALVAAVSTALDIIDQEPERRERLWYNTNKMIAGFKSYGFDIGDAASPIIPVVVGDDMLAFKMALMLQEEGVFANPVAHPATPPDRALIRTSYMATHTDEQLDRVLEAFVNVGKQVGLIQ
ncbi:MAG: pyridoxal phosphate-dependent aminotransferase family protein [bacterium]|nr:pyridoxal phosphate-dependent aminotransferase family protein [bacterium]MDT8366277.1 pyridoxal phosphate-dependent aminotransferase family protein [bacterium]